MRRRDLLIGVLATSLPVPQVHAGERGLLLGAWRDRGGADHAGVLASDGTTPLALDLAARVHGFALHPRRPLVVMVGRRPGWEALVADLDNFALVGHFAPPEGSHFNGHGVFSRDGRLLYTTETDIESGDGALGVYDGESFARLATFVTFGRDPHQLLMSTDGATLVVANGGILTHPDAPHANLDPAGMDPSLVHLDARDGRLLAQARFPAALNRLSIRHLAAIEGGVAVALQHEGPSHEAVPLLAVQRGAGPLQPLDLPEALRASCRNYIGSVACDASGRVLGATAPKGGRALFWDLAEHRALASVALSDACGIAPADAPGRFFVSGRDGLFESDAHSGATRRMPGPDAAWDNHLARIV